MSKVTYEMQDFRGLQRMICLGDLGFPQYTKYLEFGMLDLPWLFTTWSTFFDEWTRAAHAVSWPTFTSKRKSCDLIQELHSFPEVLAREESSQDSTMCHLCFSSSHLFTRQSEENSCFSPPHKGMDLRRLAVKKNVTQPPPPEYHPRNTPPPRTPGP